MQRIAKAKNWPRTELVYSAAQLYALDLPDGPNLGFWVEGHPAVIQTSHVTVEELLSVPGFAVTEWRWGGC